jgi:hypothetical protein
MSVCDTERMLRQGAQAVGCLWRICAAAAQKGDARRGENTHARRRITLAISMRAPWCYGRRPMAGSPVELKVGGQTYRVVASAEEAELKRLADLVDARLRSMSAP